MTDFTSLQIALERWFGKHLRDLPYDLRSQVERDLFPLPWDTLTEAQRRSAAKQWDDEQYWWGLSVRMTDLKRQITEWQLVSAPTADMRATKEARLAALRTELEQLGEEFKARDGAGAPLHAAALERPEPVTGSSEWRKQNARKAAKARHEGPGGYAAKKQELLTIWASGKHPSRAKCAEKEAEALGVAPSSARRWLRKAPEPNREKRSNRVTA